MLLLPRALAADLDGRATLGYRSLGGDQTDAETFTHLYELRFAHDVTEELRYRLALLAQQDLGTRVFEVTPRHLDTRQLHPFAQVLYRAQRVRGQLAYDLVYSRSAGDAVAPTDLVLTRLNADVDLEPLKRLNLRLQAQHRADRAAGTPLDTRTTIARSRLDYGLGDLLLTQELQLLAYEDLGGVFSRRTYEVAGGAGWRGDLLEGRLQATANAAVRWSHRDEQTTSGRPVAVPREETPLSVLYGVDESPLDSQDAPLADAPALADGSFATSAGISLGPQSPAFQTFAVDMGRTLTLDAFRLHVRDPLMNPLPVGASIQWEVYTSQDGFLWALADGAPRSRFDAERSLYEIAFLPTEARFFKLVAFGANTRETLVTELQVLETEVFEPQAVRASDHLLNRAQASLTFRPTDSLRFQYLGYANASRFATTRTEQTTTSLDWMQSLGGAWRVSPLLTLDLRLQDRGTTGSLGATYRYAGINGGGRFTFVPELTVGLLGGRAWQLDATGRHTITSGTVETLARVYANLSLGVNAGLSRQAWEDGATLDRLLVSALGRATLTSWLRILVTATVQRSHQIGEIDGGYALIGDDDRYQLESILRPSPQFTLAARHGWVRTHATSAFLQRYRLDWYPFPEGAVRFGFNYEDDIQPFTGNRLRRVSFLPRWEMSRNASLSLTWSVVTLEGTTTSRNHLLFASFSISS